MDTQVILICAADHPWTLEALHLAGSLSLDTGWDIKLLKLVAVDNPYLLGAADADAYRHYSLAEHQQLQAYIATLEAYGVSFSTDLFQYVSRAEAIVDAAEQFGASIVFATLPHYRLSVWRRFELWNMRRQLNRQHRTLYTLENALDALVWPSPNAHAPVYAQPELPVSGRDSAP